MALFFDVDMTKTKPLYYDVEYYVWNDGEARYNLRETKRKGENKWVNAKTQLDVDIPDYYNDNKLIYTDPRMYEVGGQTISTGSTIKAYYASNYEYVDKTYTIRYHTTQGEGVMENSIYKFFENNLLSANKFVYSGNKFKGWALARDGEIVYSDRDAVVFANDTNLTNDNGNYYLDLYAIWETGVYQVQYNANGATSGTMENTVHKFNETSKLGKNQYSKDYTLTLNVGANNTNFYTNSFGNWGKTRVNYNEENNEYTMIVPDDVEKYDGFFYTRNDAIIESGKTVTISYDVYSDKEITLGLKVQNQIVGTDRDNLRKDGDNKTIIDPTVIPAEEWTTIYFTYKNNSQNSIYDYSVLAVDESNGNTNVIIRNPRLEKTNLKTVINDENITAVVSSRFLNWISESNKTYYDEQEIVNLTNESGKIISMTAKWESVDIILPEIRNEELRFMGWKDDAGNDVDLSKPLNLTRNMTLTAIFKDDIPPEVKVDVLETTPNTITVQASATDKGMGMNDSVQYMYYIKEKNELNYTEYNGGETQTFRFDNLKQGTEYDIKVVVISDKAGNNGEGNVLATTNNFTGTIYVEKIDWITSEDGPSKAMVRFATRDLSDSTFYLECKKESEEEWTIGNTVFDVENEETVFARLTDGTNISQSISVKVEDQIKPNITIESNTSILKAYNTINIYIEAEDNETGLPKEPEYKYSYKKENENNYITGTANGDNISIENLEQNTVYDIIVEVSDYAGNKNQASIKVKTSYKYDLIFDAGLPTEVKVDGSMGKWECYKDVTYIIPECGFKAEGYKFLHWKIGNKEYNPKDEVSNLSKNGESVTLTAVWEKQEEQNPQGQ